MVLERNERSDQVSPGEAEAAQHEGDVLAEPPTGDQDHALAALGVLVRELHGDAAAE